MKRLKKWRYYCDYCKKSGGSGGHMKRHEESCTLNPNRICGMCKHTDEKQAAMADMIKVLDVTKITPIKDYYSETYTMLSNEKEMLEKLREVANGCPACMLAALRQHGYPFMFDSFRFNDEKKSFWADANE